MQMRRSWRACECELGDVNDLECDRKKDVNTDDPGCHYASKGVY